MITAASWLVRVRKETRAIAPAWLTGAAIMVASVPGDPNVLTVVGYVTGAVALGALSVGHEYGNRTMTLLLSQPTRRESLFLHKLLVLVGMIAGLAAVAWPILMSRGGLINTLGMSPSLELLTFGLPLLCGLLLAPWLTMACRSALAGIVFTVAIPVGLWLVIPWVLVLAWPIDSSPDPFDVFWYAMTAVLALAALDGWRRFMRLEALDGRGFDLHLPSWGATDAARVAAPSRRWGWRLIGKELRLQQLTFVVSAVYLAAWLGLAVFGNSLLQSGRQTTDALAAALSILHAGAIPLLVGSLASAEERNFGTLGWQVLLPVAMWKQWIVKSVVVIGLSVGLAIGLPALVAAVTGTISARTAVEPLLDFVPMLTVVGISVASLYVSSLNVNGVRAMLIALPLLIVVGGPIATMALRNTFLRLNMIRAPLLSPEQFAFAETALAAVLAALLVIGVGGLLVILLAFAMANHRTAERGTDRIARQAGWVTGSAALWFIVWSLVFAAHTERFEARSREWRARMDAQRATAVFNINEAHLSSEDDVLVVMFAEQPGRAPYFSVVGRNQSGGFRREFYAASRAGAPRPEYAVVAVVVDEGTSAWQFERQLISSRARRDALRALATPLPLRAGGTVTIPLTPASPP